MGLKEACIEKPDAQPGEWSAKIGLLKAKADQAKPRELRAASEDALETLKGGAFACGAEGVGLRNHV